MSTLVEILKSDLGSIDAAIRYADMVARQNCSLSNEYQNAANMMRWQKHQRVLTEARAMSDVAFYYDVRFQKEGVR